MISWVRFINDMKKKGKNCYINKKIINRTSTVITHPEDALFVWKEHEQTSECIGLSSN
jgi:hypothetical protein